MQSVKSLGTCKQYDKDFLKYVSCSYIKIIKLHIKIFCIGEMPSMNKWDTILLTSINQILIQFYYTVCSSLDSLQNLISILSLTKWHHPNTQSRTVIDKVKCIATAIYLVSIGLHVRTCKTSAIDSKQLYSGNIGIERKLVALLRTVATRRWLS